MANISNEELLKVVSFVDSCNNMIEGKFILANVKIRKILEIVENCESIYNYIGNCMTNFNFEKELQRAEVKNHYNGSQFLVPQNKETLVALVFCLLVSFDTQRIDFYQFIQQNFETLTPNGEYANFARTMLIPFKDAISSHFGIVGTSEQDVEQLILKNESGDNQVEDLQVVEQHIMEDEEEVDCFDELSKAIENLIDKVYIDRKIKNDVKQNLLYILKSAQYSLQYKDMRLIAAFITAFDSLAGKIRSIQFLLDDVKLKIKNYYDELDV